MAEDKGLPGARPQELPSQPQAVPPQVTEPEELDDPVDRILTLNDILSFDDLKPVKFKVPEWGGSVYIRLLSAAEGAELSDDISSSNTKTSAAKTIVRCVCDAAGNRLFTEQHAQKLIRKSLKAVNKVAIQCLRVNGLLKESAKMEAEAAKND